MSGGHTSLLVVEDYNTFRLLGQTRDDAAGEAFDKIARFMGLPYPGGPEIEKLALSGKAEAIDFPRPLLLNSYDFSFSGLKSAVINYLHAQAQRGLEVKREDVAASFQEAIVDVLVTKCKEALIATGLKKVVLAGGCPLTAICRKPLPKALIPWGRNLSIQRPSSVRIMLS